MITWLLAVTQCKHVLCGRIAPSFMWTTNEVRTLTARRLYSTIYKPGSWHSKHMIKSSHWEEAVFPRVVSVFWVVKTLLFLQLCDGQDLELASWGFSLTALALLYVLLSPRLTWFHFIILQRIFFAVLPHYIAFL